MLKIRTTQIDAFSESARDQYLHRLAAHLRVELPDRVGELRSTQILELVSQSFDRARQLGFVTEGEIARFTEVFVLTGAGFLGIHGSRPPIRMLRDANVAASWPELRPYVVATVEALP